jgi:hypothetical protein
MLEPTLTGQNLTDAELHIVAEVVEELAKIRAKSLDKKAKGFAFARAAVIDPNFKAKLLGVHRRLGVRRATKIPRQSSVPIGLLLLRDLERHAEVVLKG